MLPYEICCARKEGSGVVGAGGEGLLVGKGGKSSIFATFCLAFYWEKAGKLTNHLLFLSFLAI